MPHPRMGTVTAGLNAALLSFQTTARTDLGSSLARRAMHALDCDRALLLAQPERGGGYESRLARLTPLSCSPKHNVLLGWPASTSTPWPCAEPIARDTAPQPAAHQFVVGADRATRGAVVRDRVALGNDR